MFVNKKVLAVAIVGALVAGNAAAADLSASPVVPAYFAKEIIASVATPTQLTTSAAGAQLQWDIGYNFSINEVRYVRVECTDNIKFDAATAVSITNPANASIGSINGLGTNVLTFSITSLGPNVIAGDTVTVSGDHKITGTGSNIDCNVALYDQPSQAQAGGTVGRISNTYFSGAYISFAPSYELVASETEHTADVEADPSFSAFVFDAGVTTLTTASLADASIDFQVADPDGAGGQTAPFGVNGVQLTLPNILAATTTMTVAGDYTIAKNANGSYTGAALANVVLTGATGNANSLSATSAKFNIGNTAFAGAQVDLTRVRGLIPVADYVATLNAVSVAPTVYAVTPISGVKLGSIVRNGTELQAPLVQIPDGWLSRMVLTNTGGTDRPYTIGVISEDGNAVGTANLTGTVKANSTLVIDDLSTVLTSFTGAKRATLNVNVAAPTKQIQGLYQIVNPAAGSLSNYIMARPGTN